MAIGPVVNVENQVTAHELSSRRMYQPLSNEDQDSRQGGMPVQDTVSVSLDRSSAVMGKLGAVNDEKNLLARNIRETDDGLRAVADSIGKMKAHLEKIVKNWPPFPQDSAERKQILMSYVSLRKEIEEMTVPRPPQPLYEKNKTLWEKLENGNLLNGIPQVSESTTDNQVRTALGGLDELQYVVTEGMNDLARAVS